MKNSPHSQPAVALRELLTQKRKDLGLTQLDIANFLNKPQSFVSKYENGERKIDVVDFIEICKAMNLSATEILSDYLKKLT